MSNQQILGGDENIKERTALCKSLEDWGYHVATAADGALALKKIKSESFRLVITECEIQGITATDLLRQARNENDVIEFLFLSRDPSVEKAVEMMKAGALDFMVRPVDPAQIRLGLYLPWCRVP